MATLDELRDQIGAEISTFTLGGRAIPPRSSLAVIRDYNAYLQFATDVALENTKARLTPVSAVGTFLEAWGEVVGVSRNKPTQAKGPVSFSGVAGTTIPAGTTVTRCDGVEYRTDAAFTFATTSIQQVPVTAVEPGAAGNYYSGGELTVGTVTAGLNAQAVSAGITMGTDLEDDESLRVRVINGFRNPCRSGRCEDYEFWVRDGHPGVSHVCCSPLAAGTGTVVIYFLMEGTYADGIPTGADLAAVENLLFSQTGHTPGVVGRAFSMQKVEIDMSLTGFGAADAATVTAVRNLINTSLRDGWDCNSNTICMTDVIAALREAYPTGCPLLTLDDPAVCLARGQVPTLGTLTIT